MDKYALAVETALGAAIQNIITDTENDAKKAINFLKESKAGRATFLPLTAVKGTLLQEKGLDDCYGYINLASELVECDSKYSGVITSLLGRTVVSEDLDSAVEIAKKYSYKFKVVTLDGQVVNAGGSMTGGARLQNAGILSRANEIEKLKKQNVWVYACELGGEDLDKADLSGNIAIVMGSEGKGVSALTRKLCDGVVTMQMYGKVNSLNVSVATGIVLYEAVRKRKN